MATVIPAIPPQYFTNAGDVAAGHLLFSYQAGTTTKQNTYTDSALATPNANPIVLDSAGRATIFLLPASYKFVLAPPTDTDPPTSPLWTRDNIVALSSFNVNVDITGIAGVTLTTNDCCYISAGDGGNTAGRWYKVTDANAYSSVSAHTIGFLIASTTAGDTGTFRIIGKMDGFTGRTAGAIQYVGHTAGTITETPPSVPPEDFPRAVAQADSGTSIVISQWVPDSLAKVSVYTTPGGGTWTKHPDASTVQVFAIGGGGGGGSGRKGAAGTARVGGGGGGGGAVSLLNIQASQLTATVAVTVGVGGTGGAAQATNSTNGNNGTNGAASTFGAYLSADGGLLGGGGGSGAGGAGGNGGGFAFIGGIGGTADVAGGVGVVGSTASNLGGGGAGSGGGITAGNAASAGGAGAAGARGSSTAGGGGGGAIGTIGTVGGAAPVNSAIGGGGAGGGGSSTAAAGGAGAVGGLYGGGGGGGGASVDAVGNSGAGGNGGNGIIIVTQF